MTTSSHGSGYYLALTFGTLLSSQGADAQQFGPRGLPRWLDVQHYAGFQRPCEGGWSGGPSGPLGAWRTLHHLQGPLQGGPEAVLARTDMEPGAAFPRRLPRRRSPASRHRGAWRSGDAGGAELHADPRADRLGGLGDAVLPGALAGPTHHDEVTVPERELQARPATGRPEHQRAR
jgi:hypothetical protein